MTAASVACRGYACDGEAEYADQNGEGECRQLLPHFGPSPGLLPARLTQMVDESPSDGG